MSHTTEIKSVPLKDKKAIKKAVEELKKMGVDCELVENQSPRMFYKDQYGSCDFVLNLKKSRYDVGLKLQKDTKGNFESYKLILDTFGGDIKKQIGHSQVEGGNEDTNLLAVGKFMQQYTKHAAINQARLQGYNVRSNKLDSQGNIHLTLAGA